LICVGFCCVVFVVVASYDMINWVFFSPMPLYEITTWCHLIHFLSSWSCENLLNYKHSNLLNACEINSKFIENFDSEFQDEV
jgi:hypothetical protein